MESTDQTPARSVDDAMQRLLADALVEVACPLCGAGAFTLPPGDSTAWHQCPACGGRTVIVREEGRLSVLSEYRMIRIVSHLKAKTWSCADHEAVTVDVTGVEQDAGEPLWATVHYVCRRRSGLWRRRVHTGSRRVNLLSYEAEMSAADAAKRE